MSKKLYNDYFVGKELLKYRPGPTQVMSEADFKKLMEKNRKENIDDLTTNGTTGYRFDRYYADKHDLEYSFSERFWESHSLNEYWEQYNHVKQLIMTGEYENARSKILKNNVMNMITKMQDFADESIEGHLSIKEIEYNIMMLTPEQLSKVLKVRDNMNNNNVNKLFPTFTEFYNAEGSYMNDLKERVKKAFQSAGIDYRELEYGHSYDYDETDDDDKLLTIQDIKPNIGSLRNRTRELRKVRNNEVHRLLNRFPDDPSIAMEAYFKNRPLSYTKTGRPYYKFVKRSLSNAYIKYKGYGKE